MIRLTSLSVGRLGSKCWQMMWAIMESLQLQNWKK